MCIFVTVVMIVIHRHSLSHLHLFTVKKAHLCNEFCWTTRNQEKLLVDCVRRWFMTFTEINLMPLINKVWFLLNKTCSSPINQFHVVLFIAFWWHGLCSFVLSYVFVRVNSSLAVQRKNMEFWLKSHFHAHFLAVLLPLNEGSYLWWTPWLLWANRERTVLFYRGSLTLDMFDRPDSFCCKWTIWFSMMNSYVWSHGITGA